MSSDDDDDGWVVVKTNYKEKPKFGDEGWQIIGDYDPEMYNPPPRTIKLKIVYEALLEGRIEWGPEW